MMKSRIFSLMLVTSLSWQTTVAKGGVREENERLKLEIEKLKLENEKLKLQQGQGGRITENEDLRLCLGEKFNQESCFSYLYDEEEKKKDKAGFERNVKAIAEKARASCKSPTDDPCSLYGRIKYEFHNDESSIPIMESYCLKKDIFSMRCVDLVKHYVGLGEIGVGAVDPAKAGRFANRCIDFKNFDGCLAVGLHFHNATALSEADSRRLGRRFLSKAISYGGGSISTNVKDILTFATTCKLELIFEKLPDRPSSSSHVDFWVRFKNHSKVPLAIWGDTTAVLSNDPTKIFVNQLLGHTFNLGGREMRPGEMIRENNSFRVDDDMANKFLPHMKLRDFKVTRIDSTSLHGQMSIPASHVHRYCEIVPKFE